MKRDDSKPFIARDTKKPLEVMGDRNGEHGYKINQSGGIMRDSIKDADTSNFVPTHHDEITKKKVAIKQTKHGHEWVSEDGRSGHDPGPLASRYKPLESQHSEEIEETEVEVGHVTPERAKEFIAQSPFFAGYTRR